MVRADCFSGLFGGFDRCKLSPDHTVEFCIGAFIVSNQNLFSKSLISISRALKRHHAKRGASAEAEVLENALHSATMFWGQRRRSAEMRNASEILRNAGGLGESISQNSLRELPDFLAGFWRGGQQKKTLD